MRRVLHGAIMARVQGPRGRAQRPKKLEPKKRSARLEAMASQVPPSSMTSTVPLAGLESGTSRTPYLTPNADSK